MRAVHPGDGLQQGVLLERGVKIHDLLDRRVESGQQHVAHHQHGQRVVAVLEPFDDPYPAPPCCRCQRAKPLLVVVARRHDERRLRPVQPVQRLLVADRGVAAGRHHLGLEAVRGDKLVEVFDEIQADRLDAAGSAGDFLLGGEPSLDDRPLVFAAVGEDAVEDLVDGLPDDLQIRQPALVKDRHRRLVPDRLLDGVGVDVGAEGPQGAAVLLVDRGAGEAKEAGVGQGLPHVGGEALVLGAVGLVHHDEDVGRRGQGRMDRSAAAGRRRGR